MKNYNDLISIIVPCYKVEEYLEQCIKSIVNQSYKNLEIILVDDGSPDNCSLICDEWSNRDSRIKVVHKENGGLSSARNEGLDIAKGKYISFIDSDDFVDETFIESLYINLKQNDADISCCGYYHYFNENLKEIRHFKNIQLLMNSCEAIKIMNTIGYFGVGSWNKLYKRELFNNIRFPIGKLSEDWFILYKLIHESNKIYYDSEPKYYYRQRNGSLTRNVKINYDCEEASKECLEFCIENYSNAVPSAIQSYVLACIGIYNTVLCSKSEKSMLRLYRNKVIKYKNKINLEGIDKSRKIQIKLFYSSTFLYNIIFKGYNLFRKVRYRI